MKNIKYTFRWTEREDYSIPDNNYTPTADSIVCEPPYDFGDYLADNDVCYEKEEDTYYVLAENGERTGEAYWIISEEETDEDIG